MNKKTKRTLTPKLRFQEFRDKPGWDEIQLGTVLTEHKLKSDGKSEVHSVSRLAHQERRAAGGAYGAELLCG